MCRTSEEMGLTIEPQDRYTLEGFLSTYCEQHRKQADLIQKVRQESCWPNVAYQYLHPRMRALASRRCEPIVKHRLDTSHDFYVVLSVLEDAIIGIRITVADLLVSFEHLGKDPIAFSATTHLGVILGFQSRRPGARKIDAFGRMNRAKHDLRVWNGEQYDSIAILGSRSGPLIYHYFTGLPIDRFADLYWVPVPSDLLLYSASWLPPQPRPEWEGIANVVDHAHDLTDIDVEQVSQIGLGKINNILRDHADTSLLSFLLQYEIPTLLAILRNGPCLPTTSMNFLNKTTRNLRRLFLDWPDPVAGFALDFFLGVRDFFIEKTVVTECATCLELFRYNRSLPTKKFCSKKCAVSSRNRRNYAKHREQRVDYYRIEMRKTRQLMKRIIGAI